MRSKNVTHAGPQTTFYVFFKLSATLSISEFWIWKLSTNYWYQKMHQIWSDKFMKSQTIRNLVSSNFYPKNARQITPSCLFTMKSSTDTILILCPVDVLYYFFYAILSYFFVVYTFCCAFLSQNQKYTHSRGEIIESR